MTPILQLQMNVKEMIEALKAIPERLKKTGLALSEQAAIETRDELRIPGAPPSYPIQWASPQQRIAFFASNGFGGGIPYRRSSPGVGAGWKVTTIEQGIALGHPWPGVVFITGDGSGRGQSSIHKNRWTKLYDAAQRAIVRLKKAFVPAMIKSIFRKEND